MTYPAPPTKRRFPKYEELLRQLPRDDSRGRRSEAVFLDAWNDLRAQLVQLPEDGQHSYRQSRSSLPSTAVERRLSSGGAQT